MRLSEVFLKILSGDEILRGSVFEEFGLKPGVPLREQDYPDGIPIEIREFKEMD